MRTELGQVVAAVAEDRLQLFDQRVEAAHVDDRP